MTDTPERLALDQLLLDIKAGRADECLGEIDLVVQARKAELSKWLPLNDLMDMLRRIEMSALDSQEAKARTGTEMNHALKEYLEHRDPAVRGLATGVRQRMFTDLLGMSVEQAAQIK